MAIHIHTNRLEKYTCTDHIIQTNLITPVANLYRYGVDPYALGSKSVKKIYRYLRIISMYYCVKWSYNVRNWCVNPNRFLKSMLVCTWYTILHYIQRSMT